MSDPQLLTRRDFVSTGLKAGAAVFTTALLPRFSADAAGPYNVLFIIIDDLRPLLGCYGHSEIHTPNIDRLAQRGTLFTRAYCQYPLCSPSRTAMLTGLRPETTGVVNNSGDFRRNLPDVVTLPQNFKKQGYHTQAVGKVTHLGRLHDDEHSWSVPSWRPSRKSFEVETSPSWQALDIEDDELRDGKTAERAVRVLEQIKQQQFFLTVGFFKPHLPFNAPRKYFELYNLQDFSLPASPTPPEDVPDSALTNWDFIRRYQDLPSGEKTLSDKKTLELTLAYAASISYVDAQIGRLFAQLETLGLMEKTVVAFCGEHGYHLGEHGIWGKQTLFEVALRSPLIVSVPRQRPTETDALAELVDIYPTLCDACRLPMPSELEGVSLMPVIDESSRPWKTAAFSLLNRGEVQGSSIRTKQHRYTEWGNNGRDGQELYDYHADSNETVNIAYLPENKQLIVELREQLRAGWQAALPDVSERVSEPDILLSTSQRADIYWINTDSCTIHRLVDNGVEHIAPTVENVVSLIVVRNRIYWVERTGNNSGRIRRSNVNGSNIQNIRTLTTAPAGITVDTVNSKLYVTTERGKIQRINVDGSGYDPNWSVGLDTPTDIAVDAGSGKMFWITETGAVYYANIDRADAALIASGYGTLGGIAVGGGKVYWTEQTGGASGKIHSADIDGNNVQELRSINAVPYGISCDADNNKIYWADSRGRIMQGNKTASVIKATVKGLVSLGDVAVPAITTGPPGTFSKYDVNRDGTVDNTDAALVADALGESPPSNARLDVNGDGSVNFLDLLLVFDNRDETNAAPTAATQLPTVSRTEIQKQIDLLVATRDNSLAAQQTLTYLQSLLNIATPEKTRLLANYPNPFNPETWIPYQLATGSDVQITIYNARGIQVRILTLGHQSEGYYTDRTRAAYWDGRNAIGERVSSGVYFYTLTTEQFSATRKMLILK